MTRSPPRTEPEQIAALVALNVKYVPDLPRPDLRSQHPKGIADLRARFTVLDHIPAAQRIGLFGRPGGYDATLRFSNGAKMNDSQRDTHGLAIKVHDVPMDTAPPDDDGRGMQDFLLLDCPIFVMGGLRDYIPFNDAFVESKINLRGKLRLLGALLRQPQYILPLLRLALNATKAPLSTPYWSTTPYALGPGQVVKYKVMPAGQGAAPPRVAGPDGRRRALETELARGDGVLSFGVIVQNNPARQPVEDPRVDWETQGARFVPLAEIRIPQDQAVAAPPDVENALAFSPGHAAREHAPLGAINRARVAIYAAARAARRAAHDAAD